MTSREFAEQLSRRAHRAGASVTESEQHQFEEYIRLLARWNSRINLTSLPVDPPTDEAVDRLLIEPLVAARHLPDAGGLWLDLGSGGGSPAIPLKILGPLKRLTMVEANARKSAFLREAVRTLALADVLVENTRFEELSGRPEFRRQASLVTVRAVRADDRLLEAAGALLGDGGRLALFRSGQLGNEGWKGFNLVESVRLLQDSPTYLASLQLAFHVEQTQTD